MPDALPVPRDEGERRCMILAWDAGWIEGQRSCEPVTAKVIRNHAIPLPAIPSPAGEAVPELVRGWGVIDAAGLWSPLESREEAISMAGIWDKGFPADAPHRACRVAIAEVVEPEPEDSWEKWSDDVLSAAILGPLCSRHSGAMEKLKARRARLLEASRG